MDLKNFQTNITPTWCPGCHNYFLLNSLKQALVAKNIDSSQVVFVYDIGCAGNMADFLKTYGVHSLHGRCIPVAMGIKMYRPDLTVCAVGGDGGVYGEGLNHLIAAVRSNINIKVFVSNNYLYSLTTGQTSPTTPQGAKTKSTPLGNPNLPLDPVKLISTINPEVYVKHVKATDFQLLNSSVLDAFNSPRFSLLDIEELCLAFGKQLG